MELYNPQLSPDGSSVVVVRKRHTYDGHEAEAISDDEIKLQQARIDADERYADPQVVILSPNQQVETIDWGWEPVFFSRWKQDCLLLSGFTDFSLPSACIYPQR